MKNLSKDKQSQVGIQHVPNASQIHTFWAKLFSIMDFTIKKR